ncbi:putative monooxygenase [Martiniozyma asiatica (nom. inval.)]|nr:putative monooxygenase [Martiniozyma asiatica]
MNKSKLFPLSVPIPTLVPKVRSNAERATLHRMIRVDQAGELGANYIYLGQIMALGHRPQLKPLLTHMREQELVHHDTFNKLQTEWRVRPSLLTPLWKVGAVGMGLTTGLLGKEAAMACTEAVETVIGSHYNDQLRTLAKFENNEEVQFMCNTIKRFRDEELEHLDTAVQNDSQLATPYKVITGVIKGVVKGAVWTAERF